MKNSGGGNVKTCWMIVLGVWIGMLSGTAAASGSGLVYLSPVEVKSASDGTEISLTFQKKGGKGPDLENRSLTSGEGWVQLEIPGVYINPSKQSVRPDKGPVSEVFTYQFDEETVRLRLYARDIGENLQKKIRISQGPDGMLSLIVAKPVTAGGIPSPKTKAPDHADVVPSAEPAKTAVPRAPESAASPVSTDLSTAEPALQKFEVLTTPVSESSPPAREPKKQNTTPIVVGEAAPDLLFSSLKMVAALALVLSLMLGCFYLFKRTLGSKMGLSGKGRLIRVVSSAYVGPKKSITLVEVSGETLVLGIAGDRITLLSKMASVDDQALSHREPSEGRPRSEIKSFDGHLRDANGKIISGDDLWSTNEA